MADYSKDFSDENIRKAKMQLARHLKREPTDSEVMSALLRASLAWHGLFGWDAEGGRDKGRGNPPPEGHR